MRDVWVWLILSRIHHMVSDLRTPEELERAYRTNVDHANVSVANSLRVAAAPYGISLPSSEWDLVAWLRESGTPTPPQGNTAGTVALLTSGRVGIISNRGTIESNGLGLSLVDPTPGRAVEAWLVPGIAYLNGA